MLRTVMATRYVTPLREGGSLPAIVEADDLGLYVLKFHGAGQGPKALIAELVAGELARAGGLPVPEIVFIPLDDLFWRAEPDDEIRDLLFKSVGLNLGLDYLPGSVTFDPAVGPPLPAQLASEIVCFDAFSMNVDRTAKNPNLLLWHKQPWLIDHGAALYFHHAWESADAASRSAFPAVKDHVLLPWASKLAEAWERLRARLTPEVIDRVVALIPDPWLSNREGFATPDQHRAAYATFLRHRIASGSSFVEEAIRAHTHRV